MTESKRQFEDKPAVREQVPLLIGLMGCSGSGKTYSALRLATGIQQVTGGDIYVIDTEARRALHYADSFKFRHLEFGAPFGSLDYLAALKHCYAKGGRTIIVDSMSHEHEGIGGYLLTQDAEVERMAGNDYAKRERVKFAAWIKPVALRRQMINGILQLNANFIFCFRAKEKTKPVTGEKPLELGFMPIAGEEFVYEMTANCLLMPKAGGVPCWTADHVGEKLMMKMPEQFKSLLQKSQPLSEDIGRAMAEWAKGGKVTPQGAAMEAQAPAAQVADPSEPIASKDQVISMLDLHTALEDTKDIGALKMAARLAELLKKPDTLPAQKAAEAISKSNAKLEELRKSAVA